MCLFVLLVSPGCSVSREALEGILQTWRSPWYGPKWELIKCGGQRFSVTSRASNFYEVISKVPQSLHEGAHELVCLGPGGQSSRNTIWAVRSFLSFMKISHQRTDTILNGDVLGGCKVLLDPNGRSSCGNSPGFQLDFTNVS